MSNPHLVVVHHFVEELRSAGIKDICISPGSRSTPLTMAFVRHGGFRIWSLLDERSAAYFALGLAKSTGRPSVLICTSGTAVGNYLPAVMEACESHHPLLVVTADRPPELHGVGSNQTIDQTKVFGGFVKWFHEMPVPEDDDKLCRHARVTAKRAVVVAENRPSGPVHINWPFREPLVPPSSTVTPGTGIQVYSSVPQPGQEGISAVAELIRHSSRGIIVCGPMDEPGFPSAVVELASAISMPVLADALSQVRSGFHAGSLQAASSVTVDTYDVMLRDDELVRQLRPDYVIRFGNTPTSKALGQYLEKHRDARQVVISPDANWQDPFFAATDIVHADPVAFCDALREELCTKLDQPVETTERAPSEHGDRAQGSNGQASYRHTSAGQASKGEGLNRHGSNGQPETELEATKRAWLELWCDLQAGIRQQLNQAMAEMPDDNLFEGRVFPELVDVLPPGTHLMVGNSMPVRDMDDFFSTQEKPLRVYANRGVSGIDGVVSTALGISAGSSAPSVLVIGDVSFYHDLNALLIAARHQISLLVVLIHNDGGGIFSFLPQSAHPDTFAHFRTAHGLSFQKGVETFGGTHRTVAGWSAFRDAIAEGLEVGGIYVVELRTNPEDNVRDHKELFQRVLSSAKQKLFSGASSGKKDVLET